MTSDSSQVLTGLLLPIQKQRFTADQQQHESVGQDPRPFRLKRCRCTLPITHAVTHKHNQVRFLGDPSVAFTKELDLSFDGASIFGGDRSKRYALVIENGAVKEAHVEPDNTGVNGKLLNL